MQKGCFGWRFGFMGLTWIMAPAAAMAYIDPGNGAYMVQALFALIGAAFFYLRHPIRSLKALGQWLARRTGRATTEAQDRTYEDQQAEVSSKEGRGS